MRAVCLALLLVLPAVGALASTATPMKGLGVQPAEEQVSGADADGIWRFYRAAPIQRTIARWLAGLSGALLIALIVGLVRGFLYRTRRGVRVSYTYLVVLVAPSMLVVLGLWIGWGQTRIDLERQRVEIRPLGIPLLVQVHELAEADRLVLVPVLGVSSGDLSGRSATRPSTFWHVRLEGPEFGVALKVQLGSEAEAAELARRLGEVVALPVKAPKPGR